MTPAEREELHVLTVRLFGVDGQSGVRTGLDTRLQPR